MPTDDPTDPNDAPPSRRQRVSGAALLDAIDALPGRIAATLDGRGSPSDTDDDDGPLPPSVTFEADPEPEPEELPEPPPVDDTLDGPTRRRSGFPRRKR